MGEAASTLHAAAAFLRTKSSMSVRSLICAASRPAMPTVHAPSPRPTKLTYVPPTPPPTKYQMPGDNAENDDWQDDPWNGGGRRR